MSNARTIERQPLFDGSGRWSWQLWHGHLLWDAGVAKSEEEAVRASNASYEAFRQSPLGTSGCPKATAAEAEEMVDLDAVERGCGDES